MEICGLQRTKITLLKVKGFRGLKGRDWVVLPMEVPGSGESRELCSGAWAESRAV